MTNSTQRMLDVMSALEKTSSVRATAGSDEKLHETSPELKMSCSMDMDAVLKNCFTPDGKNFTPSDR